MGQSNPCKFNFFIQSTMSYSQNESRLIDAITMCFEPEEIKGMRNAVQELMQFCVSDEDVLASLDTNTCHYAMELTKILNKSIETEGR